ncbi:helix-turn-helix domain-containing protein [Lebetimonas sp. JH292]|uniref:helix-turn-helix domain-containing protein n=1 Tax=Lebetimonas sp. JH292 TaxID=990068 RepID=UPI00350F5130
MLSDLGKIIKKLRKEKNLSQEELAKKANISRATLSKLENGNLTKISCKKIKTIGSGVYFLTEMSD